MGACGSADSKRVPPAKPPEKPEEEEDHDEFDEQHGSRDMTVTLAFPHQAFGITLAWIDDRPVDPKGKPTRDEDGEVQWNPHRFDAIPETQAQKQLRRKGGGDMSSCLVVASVLSGSPAELAGITTGAFKDRVLTHVGPCDSSLRAIRKPDDLRLRNRIMAVKETVCKVKDTNGVENTFQMVKDELVWTLGIVGWVNRSGLWLEQMGLATYRYQPANGQHMNLRKVSNAILEKFPSLADLSGTELSKENSTGHKLHPGDTFEIAERKVHEATSVTYLRLNDGRGWAFEWKPGVGKMCEEIEGDSVVGSGASLMDGTGDMDDGREPTGGTHTRTGSTSTCLTGIEAKGSQVAAVRNSAQRVTGPLDWDQQKGSIRAGTLTRHDNTGGISGRRKVLVMETTLTPEARMKLERVWVLAEPVMEFDFAPADSRYMLRFGAQRTEFGEPGAYMVTRDVGLGVTEDRDIHSRAVGDLQQGGEVYVQEVWVDQNRQQLRGRIRDPRGWITMQDLEDMSRWVSKDFKAVRCAGKLAPTGSGLHKAQVRRAAVQVVEENRRRAEQNFRRKGAVELLACENCFSDQIAPYIMDGANDEENAIYKCHKCYTVRPTGSVVIWCHACEDRGDVWCTCTECTPLQTGNLLERFRCTYRI